MAVSQVERELKETGKRLKNLHPESWTLHCEDDDYRIRDGNEQEIGFFFGYLDIALFFLEAAQLLPQMKEVLKKVRTEKQAFQAERDALLFRAHKSKEQISR